MRVRIALFAALLLLLGAAPAHGYGATSTPCVVPGTCGPVVITDGVIPAGTQVTLSERDYLTRETLNVYGTLVVTNARLSFAAGSNGIHVRPGGNMVTTNSIVDTATSGISFRWEVDHGGTLDIRTSQIHGFQLLLSSPDTLLRGNRITDNERPVFVLDGAPRLENNHFIGATIAVDVTRGAPTFAGNLFEACGTAIKLTSTVVAVRGDTIRDCGKGIEATYSRGVIDGVTLLGPGSSTAISTRYPSGVTEIVNDRIEGWALGVYIQYAGSTFPVSMVNNIYRDNGQNCRLDGPAGTQPCG